MIENKIARNRELDALWDYYSILEDVGDSPKGWRDDITAEKYAIPFDEAKRVGGMIHINYNAWTVSRDAFMTTLQFPFEGDEYPVLAGYEDYFWAHYRSDYRILPPKEKQIFHSFPAYKM